MLANLFFFNDTATTEIYTLSLHDALPISADRAGHGADDADPERRVHHRLDAATAGAGVRGGGDRDRKSTRLNSSHGYISYAVFCLKKKNTTRHGYHQPVKQSPAYPHAVYD